MTCNPFFFGKAVTGSSFINRQFEIESIGSSLLRGQSVILFSPRRYGKTSLITHVLKKMKADGALTFYLDLYRITSLERFGEYYSRMVLQSLESGADKLFSVVRSLVPSLKPKLTYSEPNLPSIELELGLETLRKQPSLNELFNFLERYCEKKKRRACVVFDEFQEITAFDPDRLLEREMRAAFQHHQRVAYAFLGSKTPLMHELFKDKQRPFYNFGVHVELGPIDEKHWIPFIKGRFDMSGVKLTVEQCDRIVACTRGHPYYTQMLCSEIWEHAVHSKKKPSDPVSEGLRSILRRESRAFEEIWDTLSRSERNLVVVLAEKGPTNVFAAAFLAANRLGAASSVQRVVQRLSQRGIIERRGKGYFIADPMFEHWLRREEE